MEALSRRAGRAGERAFIAGLVSLFHVAVGLPLEDLARRLGLDDELREALVARAGELGALLALAEAMERADDDGVQRLLARLPALGSADLLAASESALRWAGTL
jgi:EAL and modified HD-GYP domain-containing signal transduction protein